MSRIAMAVVAVISSVVAVIGAVGILRADTSTDVGRNVIVNRDGPVDANNSPSIARNPRRPENVVISHRLDRPDFSGALHWSLDGGATWQPTTLPLPPGKERPYGPDVAFASDGTLYVSYVDLERPANDPANLWLSTSSDGGRTLTPPVMVTGRHAFQARLAVDPKGTMYLTWLQGNEVGNLSLLGTNNPVMASRSTDGGRSFSPPVRVSDPGRRRVGAASPVIDSKGQLLVLYEDFKDDVRDFEFLEGPAWDRPFGLVLTRSVDGGASFSPGIELESGVVPSRRFLVYLPEFPSLATGAGDTLYVAWADGRNDDEDVFLRRSGDGGRTWDSAVRVNDNPEKDGTAQYLPRLAVAPGGRVDVLFLDRRRDPADVMTETTLASSHDGGRSFSNTRVSSAAFDSRVGPVAAQELGVDFGSRLGLDSGDEQSLAAWTDTRLGNEDTGRQDVMVAAFNVPSPPSGIYRVPVVLSLLVLSALALAGYWFLGRSRPEATTGSSTS